MEKGELREHQRENRLGGARGQPLDGAGGEMTRVRVLAGGTNGRCEENDARCEEHGTSAIRESQREYNVIACREKEKVSIFMRRTKFEICSQPSPRTEANAQRRDREHVDDLFLRIALGHVHAEKYTQDRAETAREG